MRYQPRFDYGEAIALSLFDKLIVMQEKGFKAKAVQLLPSEIRALRYYLDEIGKDDFEATSPGVYFFHNVGIEVHRATRSLKPFERFLFER